MQSLQDKKIIANIVEQSSLTSMDQENMFFQAWITNNSTNIFKLFDD